MPVLSKTFWTEKFLWPQSILNDQSLGNIIILHSTIAESRNIGMGSVRLSLCLSISPSSRPCTLLNDGWMDVLTIWYHDQVPWTGNAHFCIWCIWYSNHVPCVSDAVELVFGYVSNLSNSGHIFMHFIWLLRYIREGWVDFIHIWYRNQVPEVLMMHVN